MAKYYVSPDGNNSWSGSTEQDPFATLEYAHSRSNVTEISVREDYIQIGFTPQKAGTLENPIIFTSYGLGVFKPTITGKKKIEGWTSIGGGLYKVTDSGFLDRVKFLLVNGAQSTVATWPRGQTYNRITGGSGNATGTLSDSVNLSGKNFTGGEVVVKKLAWTIDTMQITNQSGSTLTFTGGSSTYNLTVGWGYFVQNHRDCCTQVGDWCQEGDDILMYFGESSPDDYEIYAPYQERLLFNNRGNNQFHGFRFEMFNGGSDNLTHLPCFVTSNSPNLQFIDCDFELMGNTVFYHEAVNCSGFTIKGGSAKNCLNIFYWNRYSSSTPIFTIENFNIENVGHIKGAGGNGSVAYSGIVFSSGTNGGLVRNVKINNVGYNGISFNGYEFLVEYCRVENACMHKNDGGAFYSFGLGDEDKAFDITKRVLRYCLAVNCLGSNDGHSSYWTDGPRIGAVEGYYLDDVVRKIILEYCIAINCRLGVKIHNNYDLIIRYCYFLLNQNAQTLWASDNLVAFPIRNIQYTGNVNYALSDQLVVRIDNKNTDEDQFGEIDNNYYFKQGGGTVFNITKTGSGANVKNQTLSQWSTQYGHDTGSHETPTLSLDYEVALNDTLEEILYPLERIRLDIDGNEVDEPFTLSPFTSKILLDDLGAVTPVEDTFDLEVRENPMEWGIAVDLTNESPYPTGTEVELQATPETWTQFFRWSRDGVTLSTNQNYLYTTRGQNDLVLGEFQPKQYPLVVTVTPIGGGTVNIESGNYTEGQQIPLVATNNAGYTFLNWQRNGEILSTNPSYTHTKTAGNETIVANFTLAKHALTVTAGTGGTATGGGSFAQGETTSLVATVAGGYQFDGWYRDNVKLSGANPYTYTARNQADTVQARFLRKSVAVISADPESGTKPLTVQFSSSGSVADTYTWDFGNGATSFLALPYTVYQDAGTYTVTLTTTYGGLTDTATMDITVTDPVYVPPTITITSPQNLSANFEAPAKLPFRVIANSELGITKVEYWVDGVLIATVTNAPYSYDWNNVEAGNYSLVAKAFDSEGSTESDPVSVTVYPPSETPKLHGVELSDFGIIAGRSPNSNISVSGHLDFPKRMGKSFHVWDDEEGVEPYVSYDEIKFEGRDIKFHGYVEGDGKSDVMRNLYAFYEFLDGLNDEVLFSCKWGSWLVIVQSEVEATPLKDGMVSIVVTFRQTDTGIQAVQSGGTADRGIDGINFGDLGFTYMNLKNQWYRPTTKDHHAIGYFTEPFQVTKAGAREMVLSGLFETETYQEMVNIISSLYSLFAKEGVRTLQINNEPFREFFVKDGFEVTNIIIKHQKCMALLSINMMELNKPVFDPDFFTDTDGNYILSNTNQKIIIRK